MIPRVYIETQYSITAGWDSQAIAWWGFGFDGFSHTDAVLPDGNLLGSRWDNPGNHGRGVRIRPDGYEQWTRVSRVKIPCSHHQQKRWIDFLQSCVRHRDKYDPEDIKRLILGEREAAHKGEWICSALQTKGHQVADVFPLYVGCPPQQVTPNAHRQMSLCVPGAVLVK